MNLSKIVLAISSLLLIPVSLTAIGQSSGAPQPKTQASEASQDAPSKKTTHTIKVVDRDSQSPVVKARVIVELQNPSKTRFQGRTDSNGTFAFTCDLPNRSVKTQISIRADGFSSLSEFDFPLSEARVIELTKQQGVAVPETQRTRP